jgi:hypothetical protein
MSNFCTRRKKKTPTLYWTRPSDMKCCVKEDRKKGGEEGHEGQWEDQELNNRMCSHNLDLEKTTQTFMLAGVTQQNVFSQPRFGQNNTNFHVVFLKQDSVSNDPETFSYVMKIYERGCAHSKTSHITLQRGFFGLTTEQLDFQFQARRFTWRSWVYLKLQCLWSRLRLGVVKTHSDVNNGNDFVTHIEFGKYK